MLTIWAIGVVLGIVMFPRVTFVVLLLTGAIVVPF